MVSPAMGAAFSGSLSPEASRKIKNGLSPVTFRPHDDAAGIQDIARHRLLHRYPHLFHDLDHIQVGGKTDAHKNRGHDVFDPAPEAAVLAAGVVDGNDLAAGLED